MSALQQEVPDTLSSMKWWTTVPGRLIMLAVSLSVALGVVAAIPGDLANAAEPSSDGVLVKVGSEGASLFSSSVLVNNLEDIGFGWVFVEGDVNDPVFQAQIAALGEPHPDTIYELLVDPLFPDQWALENTGQDGGTVDADIDAPEAWAITEGDPGVVVAVLDTGADLDHPDLVDRIWTNVGEIAGNGIDDDGNGYIDDLNGWDFYGDDGVTADNDPSDITWHGTAVSGTVAATRNDIGIVGTSPLATLMPVRACYTSCPLSKVVEGINYAITNGADIINMSFGATVFDQPLADAVAAAHAAGVLVVAAAGNSGTDNDVAPLYPANLTTPNVISVAATNRFDELADFSGGSNFGATSVDLAAPGQDLDLATLNGGWKVDSGTSFSSPMVAGAAAMILAVRPDASPTEVKQILFDAVDPLPSLTGKMVTGGRLNMEAAIVDITTPVAVASASPSSGTLPFTTTIDSAGSSDPFGTIVGFSWLLPNGSTITGPTLQWSPQDSGSFDITLTVTDDDGLTASDTVTITANEAPTAVADAAPLSGTVPFTVTLDGTGSTDIDGSVVSWDWDSGTYTASGETPTITIDTPGNHVFTLTVTDDDGATDTDTVTVTATGLSAPNTAPTAVASGTPGLGVRPLTVSVSGDTSSDADGSIVAWDWRTGSVTASGRTTTITLDTVGVHEVELTVTDDDGATATDTIDVLVGEDFTDTRTSIFRLDIAWMSATGITKGCNPPTNDRYCPDGTVTRGQMAAFLARALNLPATSTDFFTDDADSIFENDINRLAASGITKGCNPPTNDRYCPDSTVTRGQMAAFLARALDLPATSTDFFADDNDSIFENDINRLAASGITKGCNPPTNDRYCPHNTVTRGQMAAFLHRAGI